MELLTLLSKPSREFTPIPFWFLNGNLSHAEIRRQLNDFNAHGVSGVVLHPRIGLAKRIRYLFCLRMRKEVHNRFRHNTSEIGKR